MHKIDLFVLTILAASAAFCTDLDDYVWRPDSHYRWVDTGITLTGKAAVGNHSWTAYLLNMTSQQWLTDADFAENSHAKSIWWHQLYVIVPDQIKYKRNATLWITGGHNTIDPLSPDDEELRFCGMWAMNLGIPVAVLKDVPNQNTIFASDPKQQERDEDAIIAFTWDHFLKDPSKPEWLLRFPMVKASLRAMDTVSDFLAQKFPKVGYNVDSYVVAGESKRGWTTWLVGAVDPKRVKAIAPVVLDALNFVEFSHRQWRYYGGFTFELQDYIDMNIMTRLDDANMVLLQKEVDPYFYKERLTMPILVINAVLDEFQQPDDSRFWFQDLPGPTHLMMVPNADHELKTGLAEFVPGFGSWVNYLLKGQTVPQFTWEISDTDGEIVATLDDNGKVYEATLWYGYSCGRNGDGKNRRDFRMLSLDNPCNCGFTAQDACLNVRSWWNRQTLTASMVSGKRTYRGRMDAPKDGWVAFMINIQYEEYNNGTDARGVPVPIVHPGRLSFTTAVSVWPQTAPYPDCKGNSCQGRPV